MPALTDANMGELLALVADLPDDARKRLTDTVKTYARDKVTAERTAMADVTLSDAIDRAKVENLHISRGLSDRQSSLNTIAPGIWQPGNFGREGRFSPTIGSTTGSDVWEVIAHLTFGARFVAGARDIITRAALRKGLTHPESYATGRLASHPLGSKAEDLDDTMQSARERAFTVVSEYLTRTDVYPVYGTDYTDSTGRKVYAVDGVVGWYGVRAVRCDECEPCQLSEGTSRYHVAKCEAPADIAEYLTVERIISRCLYAAASASLDRPRSGRAVDIEPIEAEAVTDTLTESQDPIATIMHTIASACALMGAETTGRNGKMSKAAGAALCAILGTVDSPQGRETAKGRLLALAGSPS